jgi:hypothetical protein
MLNHYEKSHKNPPSGKPFSELYNVDTLEPNEEWLDIYHRVSDDILHMGLDVKNAWKNILR